MAFNSPTLKPNLCSWAYMYLPIGWLGSRRTLSGQTLTSRIQPTVDAHPGNVQILGYGSFAHAIFKELLNLFRVN